MVITGFISKEGNDWSVIVELLSCFSAGATKHEAFTVLAAMVKDMASRDGKPIDDFDVTVTDDGATVYITSNDSARLTATLLRHQREFHQLSLADVAERLQLKSRSTYARYEQGTAEPTMTRMQELLAVVAPELVLSVVPRGAAVDMEQQPMRVKERRGPKPTRKRSMKSGTRERAA